MHIPEYISKKTNYNFRGVFSFRTIVLFFIPLSRLRPHIPIFFDIPEFKIGIKSYGLIGIEHLEIKNFKSNYSLGVGRHFRQTNYLSLVKDGNNRETGYFYWGGTSSGRLKNTIFNNYKAPWYKANYKNELIKSNEFYKSLFLNAKAQQLKLTLELDDLNKPPKEYSPFKDMESLNSFLQKPDYYVFENRNSKKLKFYKIQQEITKISQSSIKKINSEVFQNLCLATNNEIKKPHSAYIFEQSNFTITPYYKK